MTKLVCPSLEIARRVYALLELYEDSRTLAAKLGCSETSVFKVALGRVVQEPTLRAVLRRLDQVERESEQRWAERMRKKTGARPLAEEPLS